MLAVENRTASRLTWSYRPTYFVKQFRCYAVLFDLAVHLTKFNIRYLPFNSICIFSLLKVYNSERSLAKRVDFGALFSPPTHFQNNPFH
jgi:hypothetical protein